MARSLSANLLSGLTSRSSSPILLAELFFDSEKLRLWSGYGTISWNGVDWVGSGLLGTISQIEDTQETRAANHTIQLTGIPSDMVALALGEKFSGRRYNLYLGTIDKGTVTADAIKTFEGLDIKTFDGVNVSPFGGGGVYGVYVVDATKIFSGEMDLPTIEYGADTATVSLNVENRLVRLLHSKEIRYTDQEQKTLFPDDRAFEYVASIQGTTTEWGKTS